MSIASVPPTTAYGVIKSIPVGGYPYGLDVAQSDDSVFVANNLSNTVSVIDGSTGVVDHTITGRSGPTGVAINQGDDSVYVANRVANDVSVIRGSAVSGSPVTVGTSPKWLAVDQTDDSVYVVNNGASTVSVIEGASASVMSTVSGTSAELNGPLGVAVDDSDDTVYVTNFLSNFLTRINGRTQLIDDTIVVGYSPYGVAVDQSDDTVYVTNSNSSSKSVSVIEGRTGTVTDTFRVGNAPHGIAVDQTDDTIFVANSGGSSVSVINGRNFDDSVTVGTVVAPEGVAVHDDSDLAYVTVSQLSAPVTNSVLVIAQVSPGLLTVSGASGMTATVSLTVATLPSTYLFDDTAVQNVTFDSFTATGLTRVVGTNAWTVTVPTGTVGSTVPVTVTLDGGLTASAGSFTYSGSPTPPAPPVTYPPMAPTAVGAVAGDSSASVSWSVPTSSGSFPVTNYQVTSAPGGKGCLVESPNLTCEISGLANGTSYSFTVRALNGAGWGPWSSASDPVTPGASALIVITGSRGEVRGRPGVKVTGTSTGVSAGSVLRPWVKFPGQMDYVQGVASIVVSESGGFAWQRRTGKKVYVYVETEDGTVRSNNLTILVD